MNDLLAIIVEVTDLRDRICAGKCDHPWDENIRRNTVARLDAALSDLRVVACRMREDQPRVTYDPATDQAVPVEKKPEPQPITEAAMRAAGPGWRAFTNGGPTGAVQSVWDDGVYVSFPGRSWVKYPFDGKAPHGIPSVFDLVSLAPPEVANVAEVLL